MSTITKAIISVSDKTGVVEFATELSNRGVEILSTGGTFKAIEKAGAKVKAVDSYTGHPEILDGRVKTLHPKIHGGILCIREDAKHQQQIKENQIEPIDLIVVNLYPFEAAINNPKNTPQDIIENIDIGGPTLIRAGAKNYQYVTVIVDPTDYPQVLKEIDDQGNTTLKTRFELAIKVFEHISKYDTMIHQYLSNNQNKFV